MYEEGVIKIAKCNKCSETFPDFIFVADTDMATDGCVSLTGLDKSIVLTTSQPNETLKDIKKRIGLDFTVVNVRYIKESLKKGAPFQEFLKKHQPPQAIYSCIYCNGDSEVIKTETKEEFL